MAKVISTWPLLFTGKLGNVIGYVKDGKQMIRKLPKRRKRRYTRLQLLQQKKFSLMIKFFKPLTPLLQQTFGVSRSGGSNHNKAVSYHIKNAVTGKYPFFEMDYSKVLLGMGSLTPAKTPVVSSRQTGWLQFTWADTSIGFGACSSDEAWVAIYCPELDQWICYLDCAVRRSGCYSADVTAGSCIAWHIYWGVISHDGKTGSYSTYLGLVNVL